MITDVEKLVVQMSADFKAFENAMAKASGLTRKQLSAIKADAANTGGAAGAAFSGAAAGVDRFGASAGRARGQVRALQGQTGNFS